MVVVDKTPVRESVQYALVKLCDGEPSKAAFARKVGVSPQNVQNWINGQNMPPVEKLAEIADMYGLSLDSMVGRDELPGGLADDETAVVEAMRKMDRHARAALVMVAQTFAGDGRGA